MPEGKTIVVLGIARSGTSMTTGLLEQFGIHVAKNEPTEKQLQFNAKGCFECKHMFVMYQIQKEIGISYCPNKIAQATRKHIYGIKTSIQRAAEGHSIWGFKSLGVEALDVILPFLNNPHIILTTRSASDHARAYQAYQAASSKDVRPITESLFDVANGNKRVCEVIRRNAQYPHYLTSYESIRKNPVQEAKNLAQFIGIEIIEEMIVKVQDFIDPRLRSWRNDGLNKGVYKKPTEPI